MGKKTKITLSLFGCVFAYEGIMRPIASFFEISIPVIDYAPLFKAILEGNL